jgi:outer membrane protein assembly factor BamB
MAVLGNVALLLLAHRLEAADWEQFRGPRSEAVSDEKEIAITWNKTENIRWKTELPGRGISSPIVAAGRVYLTAVTGYEQSRLHVLAFDAATGKKLWDRQIWATHYTACHPTSNMAANTSVSDGENIYSLFGTGDVVAYDRDGNLLWYRSLGKDYPGITNQVGMASSLAIWKNVLFVPMENAGDSFVAGLDAKTGENLWKVSRPRSINWVTPLVASSPDRVELVLQSGEEVSAYEPRTGKLLWKREMENQAPVPAILFARGMLFVPGKEYAALRPGTDGKAPEVIWTNNKVQSGYTSPVYFRERIYYVTTAGVLNALDARDGKNVGQVRVNGKRFWTSPIIANGKLYITSEDGITTVVELGEEMKVLSKNELDDTIFATPALYNGAYYIRSDKYLYCIGEKKGKE